MSTLYPTIIFVTLVGPFLLRHYTSAGWSWKRVLRAYVFVSVPFIIWDIIVTDFGHWSFNGDFVLGARVFGLPVSEVLFFFVVPLFFVSVFEIFRRQGSTSEDWAKKAKSLFTIFRIISVPTLTILAIDSLQSEGRSYTFMASTVAAITVLVLSYSRIYQERSWFMMNVVAFISFFIVNSILTAAPIVEYSSLEQLDFRIGTIPIEDFLYNFALANLFIVFYEGIKD